MEYPKLLQLAQEAYNNRMIKASTISAFARASLMTMANFAIKVEQENERIREEDKKRRELQAITGPSKIKYPTPLSQYMRF
jgi:hypothetical protein